MPNIKSAFKRMRQNTARNLRHRSRKSAIRTLEKKYREKIAQNDVETAQGILSKLTALFDKAAKVGTIPKSRCNRKKSRLTLLFNQTTTKN